MKRRRAWILGIVLFLLPGLQTLAGSGPDYELWDDLLVSYVRNGFVDYDGFARDPRLDQFVAELGTTEAASLNDSDARKAFYINAYNAIAIRGILDGYATGNQGQRNRFFTRLKYDVLGEPTTLQQIEHGELRPMGDPRIHFAIVCASLSCPRLSSAAYRPEQLDAQLELAATAFINDHSRNRFDASRKIAFVSKIFDWFSSDFATTAPGLQIFLSQYVQDPEASALLAGSGFTMKYAEYDWNLNGQLTAPR